MKLILKLIIILIISIISLVAYLSLIGFETEKFNKKISKKIENINKNFQLELKEIQIKLDPFSLRLNAKTIGAKIKNKDKILEIENIKTQIPINSLINDEFLISNLEISTKSLEIKNLISFIRVFYNDPKLYIFEKILKKGFLIADVKLDFDNQGKIKKGYNINGFVRDTKINLLKKYEIDNLDFIFNYNQSKLDLKDLSFRLNDLNFSSKKIHFIKNLNDIHVKGEIKNETQILDEKKIELFFKSIFSNLIIESIKFSSKNTFSFNFDKKFKFNNLNLESEIKLDESLLLHKLNLKTFFPKLKNKIELKNHKIKINYKKNNLKFKGKGNILIQDKFDELDYEFNIKDKQYNFKTFLKLKENPLIIDFLNYKNQGNETSIKIEGNTKNNERTKFDLISLKEKNNYFKIEGLALNSKLKIIDLNKAQIEYIDKSNVKNKYEIQKENNDYLLLGSAFNADRLIQSLIENESKSKIFNKNIKLRIKIDKFFLDKSNILNNFKGRLSFEASKITDGDLSGSFSKNKRFNLTIKTNGNEKITTLFLDNASPIVSRYNFIKGFEEGVLDFYSSKTNDESISTLNIYDFKLKELPTLTKLLTLASLQGIADILSGEGIRFNNFEMNFRNKGSLTTIDEIYAIGPAISILMNGYIEKDKLVSLRGTLVPATTLNKVIGSIPLIGKILVGKKTGEGVFGVSFKIKGPPKNLETTVNPIKTLTPRFITRTLEKIKKN